MNYLEIAKNKAKQQPQLPTLETHNQTWKTRLTFIWALVLWQISSALPAITSNRQGHFELWKIGLFLVLFAACVWLSYIWALKFHLIPKINWRYFQLSKISAGFGLMFVSALISSIIMMLTGTNGTENQDIINSIGKVLPPLVFVIMATSAGFFEELIFRVSLFELLFNKWPKVAAIFAWALFTAAHRPTDFASFMTYGLMSLVLTGLYAKYRNFYLNLSVHFLWNALGMVGFFLTK
ncbi:MAG: CPBP family intramembrane glutamic endopeptidase [Pseudolactococcus laudensis]|uniref:CPBP family intramembrane metalloprotease n=1 Tax=Pseudolactococcus laudensis TaxID=1494461 RepID=A0A7V8SIW2_9LACT|nr:type II CAAX endopeptidase family protein [Lactococcus laudensis]MBA0015719.1 CPBP family intramembrane metalloprotease [Lactococcus laudensis]MBW9280706.1 CPBP family intramembrane metalloprotease [Lactococcus laudensis]